MKKLHLPKFFENFILEHNAKKTPAKLSSAVKNKI